MLYFLGRQNFPKLISDAIEHLNGFDENKNKPTLRKYPPQVLRGIVLHCG